MTVSPRRLSAALAAAVGSMALLAVPGTVAMAQDKQEKPQNTLSIPVSPEQASAEVTERERLNREQAEFAANQLAQNAESQRAHDEAADQRQATIARNEADAAAAQAAYEAEVARRAAEYDAAMARWRADVAACQAGDVSRCSVPQPK